MARRRTWPGCAGRRDLHRFRSRRSGLGLDIPESARRDRSRARSRRGDALRPGGVADASDDFDGQFRDWCASFWAQAGDALGLAAPVEVATDMNRYEITSTGQRLHGSFSSLDATAYRMVDNRELLGRVAQNGPLVQSTRHIEFELPDG